MPTIKIKFSPSINILRDSDYEFNYIITPNTTKVFNQLFSDAMVGVKCHTIIGAYGIGKSSFLLATQQTLVGQHNHFQEFGKLIKQLPHYEFISIVGEYDSLIDCLATKFLVSSKNYTSKDVLKAIEKEYIRFQKKGKGLAIIIDEFGKFLEYSANHQPEAELYFIQQLAEFINNSKNETLLITTLHQGFNAYAAGLNRNQQQEWDKVSGRLKEIVFNEPVEQLLFLAAERINQKFPDQKPNSNFDKLFTCITNSKAFPLKDYLDKDFAKKLLPFDLLSAAVLALSLQKYGQNERSLFSFIESNDYLSIHDFVDGNTYYSVPEVYDYLINNYHSFLSTSINNSHYTQWSAIRQSLEKLEGVLKEDVLKDACSIVKTIGLLNIFASGSGKLDLAFYVTYCKLALGIKNPEKVIKELEKFKIIWFAGHNFRYSLLQGTNLDIDLAIDKAGRIIEKVTNVVNHLNQYFDFPFISAKEVSYETGTPRFFQFKLSEEPIKIVPEGEVDGFINLVFAEDPGANRRIEECSRNCQEAIMYGYYKNTAEIKKILFEIQKVKNVIAENKDDKDAIKELKGIEEHYRRLLNHYVLDSLYSNQGNIIWYYNGARQRIVSRQSFNQTLTSICNTIYYATPVFRNELINKTNISGQIATARKKIIERLLTRSNEENIGFKETEFPPEKTIYLALLKQPGIHKRKDGIGLLNKPISKSFNLLWQAGDNFLHSTKIKERSILEFIDILSLKPFKLKRGFIDFWVPIFLLAKKDEFALYENGLYVPELENDILELLNKKPGLFKIKAFDVAGIKLELFNRYRVLLNQAENNKPNNKTFIQTIKPFLTFYRDLPEYSKRTSRLEKRTLALRQVIASAKDPEKVFFDDFPTALGYNLLDLQLKPKQAESFIKQLQESIKELRSCYDGLVDRFETYFIKNIIGNQQRFPDYKSEIKKRYRKLKGHLLLNHQKAFYTRLQSEIDDRKIWLSSIAQSCIGKPLESISDEEEFIIYDKLNDLIYELDNLCEISLADVGESEDILKLEITSFVQGLNKNLLRIPKTQNKEIHKKLAEIKLILGKDKKVNVTILAKLLQELLKND